MIILKSPPGNIWAVDLKEYTQVRKYIPMNGFSIVNNSPITADIYLHGAYVGTAYPYGAFSINGQKFETFRIENPDGQDFYEGELIATATEKEAVSQSGYNPMIEAAEDNLDRYANGCDHRVSLSVAINKQMIAYIINRDTSRIVQRRIEFEAGAIAGKYELNFSEMDVLSGAVPLNSVILLDKRVTKTISDCSFFYDLTDCDISGWIVDYKEDKTYIDIMDTAVEVTGGADMIDDSLSTSTNFVKNGAGVETLMEYSFDSTSISQVHFLVNTKTDTGGLYYNYFDLKVNNVWTNIGIDISTDSADYSYDALCLAGAWNIVTGIRMRGHNINAGASTTQIYDVTLV